MSDVTESKSQLKMILVLRIVTGLGLSLALAWIGGKFTGVDMWTFVDKYALLFYACVAGISAFLVSPVMRKLRD